MVVNPRELAERRRELLEAVATTVRQEMRVELILAGISPAPMHWTPEDQVRLAKRLRAVAEELDPLPATKEMPA